MEQKSRPSADEVWDAETDKAQACASPTDLRDIVMLCHWRVQQAQLLLRTGILAYYNDGQTPRPTIDKAYPKAELEVAARKSDWHPGPDGEYVESEVAMLARELDQALKLGDVHLHGLAALTTLTEKLAKNTEDPA